MLSRNCKLVSELSEPASQVARQPDVLVTSWKGGEDHQIPVSQLTPCHVAGFFIYWNQRLLRFGEQYWNEKNILIISFAMASILVLSACSPAVTPNPVPDPISIQDGLGRTITLEMPAQKVISLAPSNTEVLFAVNAGPLVIARDEFSNYPPEAQKIESIGGSMGSFSLEKITSLQPDLILAAPIIAPELIKSLEDIGLKVFVLPNPAEFDDLYRNLQTVGALTGHQQDAEKLVTDLKERVAKVENNLAAVEEKPLVFYELDATEPSKPWTAGPGTFVDYLITKAGAINLGANLSAEWVQISQEELLIQDPDFILLGDSLYGGITPQQVAARPGWAQITAVEKGNVLPFNDDLVSRPGPRMVDGLEQLAAILHPEVFK